MRPHRSVRKDRRNRGQAMIEMGFVVVLLTFLAIGIVEVGYAFARTNMIVHAARDGARFGATLDTSMRVANTGCFTGAGTSAIHDHVQSTLDAIGFNANSISVSQMCSGVVPIVTVTIQGPLHFLFDLIGDHVNVNRAVTFEDEGRVCNGGGGC